MNSKVDIESLKGILFLDAKVDKNTQIESPSTLKAKFDAAREILTRSEKHVPKSEKIWKYLERNCYVKNAKIARAKFDEVKKYIFDTKGYVPKDEEVWKYIDEKGFLASGILDLPPWYVQQKEMGVPVSTSLGCGEYNLSSLSGGGSGGAKRHIY